jgi:AraC-like DNA-binding protein
MVEVGELMENLGVVPLFPKYRAQPWLEHPLRTPAGELHLAGLLQNVHGLDPARMRTLRHFTLMLMVEGTGYYRDARGQEAELAPGDVVVVFPEIAHAYGPSPGGEWTQVYCVFDGPQFVLWRRVGLLDPGRPVLRLGSPEYWKQRLSEVFTRDPSPRVGDALRAFGRFVRVLADMLAAESETNRAARDSWFDESLRLLGDRSAAGWVSPQDAARRVGLAYENFRKRFAQLSGESPGRYQKRRRLEWACATIFHGQRSFKQIADELGFCDVFHFSKAFKQEIGVTPSEYRRRVRGT